jgi:hypothetical protein
VRDHHDGYTKLFKNAIDRFFLHDINMARGFIEKQYLWLLVKSPSENHTLPLTAGQAATHIANERVNASACGRYRRGWRQSLPGRLQSFAALDSDG